MMDTQLFKQFHKAGLKIVRVLMELLISAAWCMAVINIDLDCIPGAVSLSWRYNRIKLCFSIHRKSLSRAHYGVQ